MSCLHYDLEKHQISIGEIPLIMLSDRVLLPHVLVLNAAERGSVNFNTAIYNQMIKL